MQGIVAWLPPAMSTAALQELPVRLAYMTAWYPFGRYWYQTAWTLFDESTASAGYHWSLL